MLDFKDIQSALIEQGLGEASEKLARIFVEQCLTWKPPITKIDRIDAVVAFAFGNRIDAYGNRTPGPINAQLADVVESISKKFNCRVLAQWEIAMLLADRIPADRLVSVNPVFDAQSDKITYLSTAGVLQQVRTFVEEKTTLYIVAHRDHLYRCMQLTERFGFEAVSEFEKMPVDYDAQSSQAWTRRREVYLVSDMMSRLSLIRQDLIDAR